MGPYSMPTSAPRLVPRTAVLLCRRGKCKDRDLTPSKKNLPGELQFAIMRCRPLLGLAAMALPAYRKCPQIRRLLLADQFCRRAEIEVVYIKSAFLALRSVP